MKTIPHFLTGLSAFIDGIGLLGTVKSVALPKVEQMRETITQGGFERSVAVGVFKAMEAEITLSNFNKYAYRSWTTQIPIVIKGSIKAKGKSYPIQVMLKGDRDIDDGNLEEGKAIERKIKVYIDFYELTVDNLPQVLIDIDHSIGIIDGVDYLEDLRSHLSA